MNDFNYAVMKILSDSSPKELSRFIKAYEWLCDNNIYVFRDNFTLKDKLMKVLSFEGSWFDLNNLPEFIDCFINLKYLECRVLSGGLPSNIIKCKKLESLYIKSNYFVELPKELLHLESLNRLKIDNWSITEFPEIDIDNYTLEVLYLEALPHIELPESLSRLINLQQLHLNSIGGKIPKSIGKLEYLVKLYLKGINNELPKSLGSLSSLCHLTLDSMNMKFIPSWVVGLKELTKLNFINNKLEGELKQAKKLKIVELSLEGNLLKELPNWIKELTLLESINLSNNNLEELPLWLLEKITYIDVSNNSFPVGKINSYQKAYPRTHIHV